MLVALNEAEMAEEKLTKKDDFDVWQTKAHSQSLGNICFNRTLQAALRKLLKGDRSEWDHICCLTHISCQRKIGGNVRDWNLVPPKKIKAL